VELVLYMPLLMFVILLVVQFALVWFGNQTASAAAREAARVARVYEDEGRAVRAGREYAERVGGGSLEDPVVTVERVGDNRFRVTVTGKAQELIPFVPTITQTVEGPIEEFEDEAP
jgi:Flp pilus assembly protein TadG